MKSVFMFRRDLRLEDNTGLITALKESDEVLPVFIFNPEQIENNEYKGDNSFEFLLDSLYDLDDELQKRGSRLYCFYGNPLEVLESLEFDKLYFNNDYTPFALSRDQVLKEQFSVESFDDILLNPPQKVLKDDGKPYSVFTPYYKKASIFEVSTPKSLEMENFYTKPVESTVSLEEIEQKYLPKRNPSLKVKGGRSNGLALLENFKKRMKGYKEDRDFPSVEGVSNLSAHNKFGTISPRELYYETLECEPFTRQLYWRDFFTQIAYHYPKVFGLNFNSNYDSVVWDTNPTLMEAWKKGKTGFPIVDAGMRELNATGYMHNRVRMIVASFLTKDFHIDWRLGEKYFAQKLVDYDPCVNNGSWQWASSTGCDAQPYFRIFNPFRQQWRFDPNCEYIKTWIPELKKLTPKQIHSWSETKEKGLIQVDYPKPIVDHFKEKEETLRRFKQE